MTLAKGKFKDPKREFRKATYEEFLIALHKYGFMTKEELEEDLRRIDTTMFEYIFGRLILDAAKGQKEARQVLFERLWGKVSPTLDVSFNEVPITPENIAELYEIARKA